MSTTRQYCTFRLGTDIFGIDVTSVQEVMRGRTLTPIPLSADAIEGLLNLRGQILTAVDLRKVLGLPARPDGLASMFIIVRDQDSRLALLVDVVGDVMEVDEASFEHPPETVPASTCAFLRGVHKLPRQLLHILNIESICNHSSLTA